MAIAPTSPKTYTAEEYLDLEVMSDVRNEYRNGAIVPMTGGTPNHNEIVRALTVIFSLALKGKPYRVFLVDQRLWIPDANCYTYPDMMIIPKPIVLQPGRKDTVTNPLLIAEVLSRSTETYDRSGKFEAYRTINTLQEYLLIDQYRPHVEQYVRQNEQQWLMTEYSGVEARLELAAVEMEVAIADLYEGVAFDAPEPPQVEV